MILLLRLSARGRLRIWQVRDFDQRTDLDGSNARTRNSRADADRFVAILPARSAALFRPGFEKHGAGAAPWARLSFEMVDERSG